MYSEEYHKMLDLHRRAHNEGVDFADIYKPPEHTFAGTEIMKYAHKIKAVHDITPFTYVLDWGCGKAAAYNHPFKLANGEVVRNLPTYLGIPRAGFTLYDPCVDEYSIMPSKDSKYDLAICIDVLEHIPEHDIDQFLDDLFSRCSGMVFITVACYSAESKLYGGVNAHCNVKPPEYWADKFREYSGKYNIDCYAHIISKTEDGKYPVQILYRLPKSVLDKINA